MNKSTSLFVCLLTSEQAWSRSKHVLKLFVLIGLISILQFMLQNFSEKSQQQISSAIKHAVKPAVVAEWSKALSQIQVERMP